mmetsp:Transcript_51967/g.121821  ORF Transcript_51967/g.121821 Transcript_51967/m.121821 type:complete len:164 (+) Transcript_51967:79-570(+)
MIKGIMIINNHGKPRLSKFYEHLSLTKQQQMIRECYSLISKRSDRVCNFLEEVGEWGKDTKLVYRVYATLYFVFVVDGSESELGILDLIHVMVETLDHVFENVCELDLIFHTDKVRVLVLVLTVAPGPLYSRRDCDGWDGVGDQLARNHDCHQRPGGNGISWK